MADPLSITASIAAVITIGAQVAKLLAKYIGENNEAPEILSNLLSDISSLSGVISNLKSTVDSESFSKHIGRDEKTLTGHMGEHWRFVKETIANCQKTLFSLKEEWDIEPSAKRPRLLNMITTHFRLARDEARIRSYRLRLTTSKDVLQIALMALTLSFQVDVEDSINQLIPRLDETNERIDQVLNTLKDQLKDVHLEDQDKVSLRIAQKTIYASSVVISSASTIAMSVIGDDRSEVGSVVTDQNRQNLIDRWMAGNNVLSPFSPQIDPHKDVRVSCLKSARKAFDEKDFKKCEALFDHALALNHMPTANSSQAARENSNDYILLSRACIKQKKLQKAIQVLKSALGEPEVDPRATAAFLLTLVETHTHPTSTDVLAAETAWTDSIRALKKAHGADYWAHSSAAIVQAKMKILKCRHADDIEIEFWRNYIHSTEPKSQNKSHDKVVLKKPQVWEATSILRSIEIGDTKSIKHMFSEKVDVLGCIFSEYDGSSLHFAVEAGQTDVVDLFIKHGANVNDNTTKEMSTPLHIAAAHPDRQKACMISSLLVKNGANPNSKNLEYGETPLHIAAARCNIQLALLLHKYSGSSGDATELVHSQDILGNTALHYISDISGDTGEQIEFVQMLIDWGADVNARNAQQYSPIYSAVRCGNFRLLSYLLECGANVNQKALEGRTVLHFAQAHSVTRDASDMMRYLVKFDADVNIRDSKKESLLTNAIKRNRIEEAFTLLELGCHVNAINQSGESALGCALEHLSGPPAIQLIALLLENKADTRASDVFLHHAIDMQSLPLVESLVMAGIDFQKFNKEMETPLQLAEKLKLLDIVAFLKNIVVITR